MLGKTCPGFVLMYVGKYPTMKQAARPGSCANAFIESTDSMIYAYVLPEGKQDMFESWAHENMDVVSIKHTV